MVSLDETHEMAVQNRMDINELRALLRSIDARIKSQCDEQRKFRAEVLTMLEPIETIKSTMKFFYGIAYLFKPFVIITAAVAGAIALIKGWRE